MIKQFLPAITLIISGMAYSQGFNSQGEFDRFAISAKHGFTYHEKIDPITDKNTSYVTYSGSQYHGKTNGSITLQKNLKWGMRINCFSDKPNLLFTVDYGDPVRKQPSGLQTSPSQISSFDKIGGTSRWEESNNYGTDFEDQYYYDAKRLIGEKPSLKVIYRMGKQEPVGFNSWRASRSGNIIKIYLPSDIEGDFMEKIMEKSKLVLRIKGNEVETYTYPLDGLSDAAKKLTCIE